MKNVRMPKSLKVLIFGVLFSILYVGAASKVMAAPAEYQRCGRGGSCEIGEFLYDDSYSPITTAGICILTSRTSSGSVYADPPSIMTSSSAGDGWYSSNWTVGGAQTEGLYPTTVCCTPVGENKICIDKSFVIGTTLLSGSEVANAVWDSQTSDHTGAGTFGNVLGNILYNIWNYGTRSLTSATLALGEQLAVKSEVNSSITASQTAVTSAVSGSQGLVIANQNSNTGTVTSAVTGSQGLVIANQNSNTASVNSAVAGSQGLIIANQNSNTGTVTSAVSGSQGLIIANQNSNTDSVNSAVTGSQGLVIANQTANTSTITGWITSTLAALQAAILGQQSSDTSSLAGTVTSAMSGSQNAIIANQNSNTDTVTSAVTGSQGLVIANQTANTNTITGWITSTLASLQAAILGQQSSDTSTLAGTVTSAVTGSQGLVIANQNSNTGTVTSSVSVAQNAIIGIQNSATGVITGAVSSSVSAAQGAILGQQTSDTSTITGAITAGTGTVTSAVSGSQGLIIASQSAATGTITGAVSSSVSGAQAAILGQQTSDTSTLLAQMLADKTYLGNAVTSSQSAIMGPSAKNLTQIATGVSGLQSTADSISTKVDSLQTSIGTVDTNVDSLITNWNNLDLSQVSSAMSAISTSLGTISDGCASTTTVFGDIRCLKDKWGVQDASSLYNAANNAYTTSIALQGELDYNQKSTTAYKDLQNLKTYVLALQTSLGTEADAATVPTIFGRIKKSQDTLANLNTSGTGLDDLLSKWGSYDAADIYNKVKNLSDDIEKVNTVPDVDSILKLSKQNSSDMKELKNTTYALKAVVDVNRVLLDKFSNSPIVKTWLEDGSVIFKTLITNPSTISKQTVPLKFYLPKETRKEDLIKVDTGLNVEFDSKEDAFFVSGLFPLNPGETKIVAVEVKDVWKINTTELDSLRMQAEDLSVPLKDSSFFAQGVTLKSDIVVRLDDIKRLQSEAYTPEDRIKTFRDNMTQLSSIKLEMGELKSLVAQSASSKNLLGFVGGAQVSSIWGIVFVLLAAFGFILIYTKFLLGAFKPKGKVKNEVQETTTSIGMPDLPEQKKVLPNIVLPALPKPTFAKLSMNVHVLKLVFISVASFAVMGAGVWFMLTRLTPSKPVSVPQEIKKEITPTVAEEPTNVDSAPNETQITTEKSVLGAQSTNVVITIPSYSDGVNVRQQPDITSPVLIRYNKDTEVIKYSESGTWTEVGIDLTVAGVNYTRGWVSTGLITVPSSVKVVAPADTDGVNVRAKPGLSSDVIGITPVEFNTVKYGESADADWVEIEVDMKKDDTKYTRGWVNKQFVQKAESTPSL